MQGSFAKARDNIRKRATQKDDNENDDEEDESNDDEEDESNDDKSSSLKLHNSLKSEKKKLHLKIDQMPIMNIPLQVRLDPKKESYPSLTHYDISGLELSYSADML